MARARLKSGFGRFFLAWTTTLLSLWAALAGFYNLPSLST